MSGFFQNFLTDAAKGFFGSEYLRDFTHASKTFRTDAYSYSPKFKFLFHVYFDINEQFINYLPKSFPQDKNFGLAVKSIQLPKYSFDLTDLNQYNRKRIVQTKIKYDPINIVFHDDNANLIRKLWYAYYTYYYKDAAQNDVRINSSTVAALQTQNKANSSNTPTTANTRNIYDPNISGNDDWGYVGETSSTQKTNASATLGASKIPFFNNIQIYGFNQHNFALYRLVNPIIESFSHDTYDYSQNNGVMENQMTLRYETVKYYEGALDGRNPGLKVKGFGGDDKYDRTSSPISRPGSNATILGQGGLLAAGGGILDDLTPDENGNINILGAVKKAGTAYNTFKNPQTILQAAKGDALGVARDVVTGAPNSNRNVLFNFPSLGQSTNVRVSTTGGITRPPTVG